MEKEWVPCTHSFSLSLLIGMVLWESLFSISPHLLGVSQNPRYIPVLIKFNLPSLTDYLNIRILLCLFQKGGGNRKGIQMKRILHPYHPISFPAVRVDTGLKRHLNGVPVVWHPRRNLDAL